MTVAFVVDNGAPVEFLQVDSEGLRIASSWILSGPLSPGLQPGNRTL